MNRVPTPTRTVAPVTMPSSTADRRSAADPDRSPAAAATTGAAPPPAPAAPAARAGNGTPHTDVEVGKHQAGQFQPGLVNHVTVFGRRPVGPRIMSLPVMPAEGPPRCRRGQRFRAHLPPWPGPLHLPGHGPEADRGALGARQADGVTGVSFHNILAASCSRWVTARPPTRQCAGRPCRANCAHKTRVCRPGNHQPTRALDNPSPGWLADMLEPNYAQLSAWRRCGSRHNQGTPRQSASPRARTGSCDRLLLAAQLPRAVPAPCWAGAP